MSSAVNQDQLLTLAYSYIGSDRAIADLPFMNGNVSVTDSNPSLDCSISAFQFATGGVATYLFWRSAYLSTLFSLRNRTLVATDWIKVKLFGRWVSFAYSSAGN